MYHEQSQAFVDIINSRINRVTKLAPNQVKNSDETFLVSLQHCNAINKPKFKLGQNVRIRRKTDLFHRGSRIQFTEEVFQIAAVETLNPPTYSLRGCNNQLIQGKFYESELVRLEKDNEQNTQELAIKWKMNQQQSFTINLVSNASMSTFPDNTLAKFTTLLPQSSTVYGTLPWWSCHGPAWLKTWQKVCSAINLIEINKTVIHQHKKLLLSDRVLVTEWFHVCSQEPAQTEQIYAWRRIFTREVFITKGWYSSVNSTLQSMCDNLCSSVGWDISQLPLSWDICESSQLLHLKFSTTSNEEMIKIWFKAVYEDLKNILGLEYWVDCSQTNNDAKQPERSHGLEFQQDCKKRKKSWKTRRNERANW